MKKVRYKNDQLPKKDEENSGYLCLDTLKYNLNCSKKPIEDPI